MSSLETYLKDLRDIRSSGEAVNETSYYGPLATLLNEVGKSLKPKVRCIINIKNRGAGLPDGGLFTQDQFQKATEDPPLPGQIPSRGVVEVKGTGDDAWAVADGPQVSMYWGKYRQVLVTNYRDFVLVGQDAEGKPTQLESYRLAESESTFWAAAAHPNTCAKLHGERFNEYLTRVLLHAAPLSDPADVAWFLASYAREARARIEGAELPPLTAVRKALQEALDMTFEDRKGDHFFRSTLVQTLFYGLFSAWVLWSKQHPPTGRKERFDWNTTARYLRVPVLRKLFHEVAEPGQLEALNLIEVMDWAQTALNRVDRASFFEKFQESHAVQYFYEPFLQAYDPELRKELGVWYTPTEIVQYMVARVDTVLQEELGIQDGLADPRVYVLDPCCGTGAYLVEVLRRIAERLKNKGGDALVANDLKRAAMERVFGFEILPAPFVVSHLQLGLLLQSLGAPLSEKKLERIGVYLTNALTDWEPAKGPKTYLLFPELEEERDAAEKVKRDTPILVILGNPPYNSFAGVAVKEERELTTAYRTTKRAPAPQGQGLNDLYVRFFRMAERRIVERTQEGIVCFISNYSWLDGLSFTGMRERYLEAFDRIWVDCLNGDKYKTGKLTPDGKPDPSVFSTEMNPEGIQVGTAISLLIRKQTHKNAETVAFRHFWGKRKRADLEEAAKKAEQRGYEQVSPIMKVGLPFIPTRSEASYFTWPSLPDLFPESFPGVKTSRDDVVIDIDKDRLVERLSKYFDPKVSHEDMRRISPGAMESVAHFKAEEVRKKLRKRGFLPEKIVRYCYRPFDIRWLYWEPETDLLDRKREEYFPHVFGGNLWIEARQKQTMERFDRGYCVRVLSDNFGNGLSSYFPLWLKPEHMKTTLLTYNPKAVEKVPNLSLQSEAYLKSVKIKSPEKLFFHSLAILHAPTYRSENSGALRQDWPRVSLPSSKADIEKSSDLGELLAGILDPETAVKGVTSGAIRAELKSLGPITRVGGGAINPNTGELELAAGWGHAGKGGVTMPGKGKVVQRDYAAEELATIKQGASAINLTHDQVLTHLGQTTYDIYLNDVAFWKNIPMNVWSYTIGGYQVIKKWLSYREVELLNRSLTTDEAREVTNIARRIAAILLLEPALNSNYQSIKKSVYVWPQNTQSPR
jgi:hypothetical protein